MSTLGNHVSTQAGCSYIQRYVPSIEQVTAMGMNCLLMLTAAMSAAVLLEQSSSVNVTDTPTLTLLNL